MNVGMNKATGRASLAALHQEPMVRALRSMLQAHEHLQAVRDSLEQHLTTVNPASDDGKAQEQFILEVVRAMTALNTAVVKIPDEFWLLHLAPTHAGVAEVLSKLPAA